MILPTSTTSMITTTLMESGDLSSLDQILMNDRSNSTPSSIFDMLLEDNEKLMGEQKNDIPQEGHTGRLEPMEPNPFEYSDGIIMPEWSFAWQPIPKTTIDHELPILPPIRRKNKNRFNGSLPKAPYILNNLNRNSIMLQQSSFNYYYGGERKFSPNVSNNTKLQPQQKVVTPQWIQFGSKRASTKTKTEKKVRVQIKSKTNDEKKKVIIQDENKNPQQSFPSRPAKDSGFKGVYEQKLGFSSSDFECKEFETGKLPSLIDGNYMVVDKEGYTQLALFPNHISPELCHLIEGKCRNISKLRISRKIQKTSFYSGWWTKSQPYGYMCKDNESVVGELVNEIAQLLSESCRNLMRTCNEKVYDKISELKEDKLFAPCICLNVLEPGLESRITKPHHDKMDYGISTLFYFGDYSGGNLTISQNMDSSTVVTRPGSAVLLRGNYYKHSVQNIEPGPNQARYSIVFFAHTTHFQKKKYELTPSQAKKAFKIDNPNFVSISSIKKGKKAISAQEAKIVSSELPEPAKPTEPTINEMQDEQPMLTVVESKAPSPITEVTEVVLVVEAVPTNEMQDEQPMLTAAEPEAISPITEVVPVLETVPLFVTDPSAPPSETISEVVPVLETTILPPSDTKRKRTSSLDLDIFSYELDLIPTVPNESPPDNSANVEYIQTHSYLGNGHKLGHKNHQYYVKFKGSPVKQWKSFESLPKESISSYWIKFKKLRALSIEND